MGGVCIKTKQTKNNTDLKSDKTSVSIEVSSNFNKIWQTQNNVDSGYRNAIFTPNGNIVISDWQRDNIIMYNSEGVMLTSTKNNGLELNGLLWGLTYDPKDCAIIVSHNQGYVTFLDVKDLSFIKKIQLTEKEEINGLDILSDGKIVAGLEHRIGIEAQSNDKAARHGTIAIFDRDGKKKKSVKYYGLRNEYQFLEPRYITVLPSDIVVVNINTKGHVVYLSTNLKTLQIMEVSHVRGHCQTPWGDLILTADTPPRLCHIQGRMENMKCKDVFFIPEEDMECLGDVISVDMRNKQLAVLGEKGLVVYDWNNTWCSWT